MFKRLFMGLTILVLAAALPGPAAAALVNFDDLGGPNDFAEVPADYQGFTWSPSSSGYAWSVMPNSYYRGVFGNTFDFPSNPKAATAYPYVYPTLSRSTPFDFVSAYLGTSTIGDTHRNGPDSVTVTGYLGGLVVDSKDVSLAAGPLSLISFNFHAVDEIIFYPSVLGGNFFIDDITYTAANVPIPPGLVLLGAGLAILLGLRRKMAKT